MRVEQRVRSQPEMQRAGRGDFEPVIIDRHGDRAATDAVIPVTHRVGQRLPQGRRRIQRVVHPLKQARLHAARQRCRWE